MSVLFPLYNVLFIYLFFEGTPFFSQFLVTFITYYKKKMLSATFLITSLLLIVVKWLKLDTFFS